MEKEVSGTAVRVYGLLFTFSKRFRAKEPVVRIPQEAIQDALGCSLSEVKRCYAELRKGGWIYTKNPGFGLLGVVTLHPIPKRKHEKK